MSIKKIKAKMRSKIRRAKEKWADPKYVEAKMLADIARIEAKYQAMIGYEKMEQLQDKCAHNWVSHGPRYHGKDLETCSKCDAKQWY
jgi:hypothetical protein